MYYLNLVLLTYDHSEHCSAPYVHEIDQQNNANSQNAGALAQTTLIQLLYKILGMPVFGTRNTLLHAFLE